LRNLFRSRASAARPSARALRTCSSRAAANRSGFCAYRSSAIWSSPPVSVASSELVLVRGSLTTPSSHRGRARRAFQPDPPRSGSRAWRELLECPVVSVGVLEKDEQSPAEVLHVGDVDAVLDQLLARGLDIGHHDLQLGGTRGSVGDPLADGDRAGGPR